jgi:hypothetical protein
MLLAIFGERGTGKTELEKQISYYLANRGRVYVFDPVGQWQGYHYTAEEFYAAEQVPPLVAFHLEEASDVADIAQATTNCSLVVDESDFLCNAHSWKSESGRNIVLRGRHSRVGLVLATQRSQNCHGDVKALVDKVVAFRARHPNDLAVFESWLGPAYAERIKRLRPHEFVVWPDGLVCKMGADGPAYEERFVTDDEGDDDDSVDGE